LAALGVDRHIEPDLARQRGGAKPGSDDDTWRDQRFSGKDKPELSVLRLDPLDTRPVANTAAVMPDSLMQRRQKQQRIGMTIAPAVARPGDVRPERDVRQQARKGRPLKHLPVRLTLTPLVVQPKEIVPALLERGVTEAESETAVLLVADIDPDLGHELVGKIPPAGDAATGQGLIGRHAEALALQPDQPEIRARGAEIAVVAIKQQHLLTPLRETVGNRGPDGPSSDDDDIRLHATSPCEC
jgi:hypothetical protein